MKSDIIASVIYLKTKVQKWRNISALLLFVSLVLVFRLFFADSKIDIDSIKGYIAEIEINDVIFDDAYRSKILTKLASQDNVKAVLVNINSPGGGIVGSEILYKNLLTISQKKPLVVLMGSVAASGAYMASLASNYIIAHSGTLTGSIGVIMESPDISQLAQKIGVSFKSFKSSPIKGYPSFIEGSNPEYDKIIQSSINDSYKFFTDLVKERRLNKIKSKDISRIFDGRVFTGRQAFELGLVDEIGFREDAISYLNTIDKNLQDLPLKEVSIIKKENNFVVDFMGKIPFLQNFTRKASNDNYQGMMAIFNPSAL